MSVFRIYLLIVVLCTFNAVDIYVTRYLLSKILWIRPILGGFSAGQGRIHIILHNK